MQDGMEGMLERLAATVSQLEQAVGELQAGASMGPIGPIVATVESGREMELVERLAKAEAEIAQLRASASAPASVTHGRKTLPAGMVNLLAKQGVTVDSMEAGALDAALVSLSIEQRIAVKAQLMRSGLL